MNMNFFCSAHRSFIVAVVTFLSFSPPLLGQQLSQQEAALVRLVDEDAPASLALLEKVVDINSGTFNIAGVIAVGKVFEHELNGLGFRTRWLPMDAVKRAPSLVAERKGNHGQRVLLIGHMDTVFEPSSPFQKFERKGDMLLGQGRPT